MKILGCLFLFFCHTQAFAQINKSATKEKWHYTGLVQGGIIVGANKEEYTVQTIHGIRHNKLILGIGVGIDNYLIAGFPIVAHGQYLLGRKEKTGFVYIQGGPQLPWKKNDWKEKFSDQYRYKLKTGWLAESGIGYQIPMGKLKLISSIGYSIKQVSYEEQQVFWIGPIFPFQPEPSYDKKQLTTRRLVFKLGIGF
jgi:hypothetical protein